MCAKRVQSDDNTVVADHRRACVTQRNGMKRSVSSGEWSLRDPYSSDLEWALQSPGVRVYRNRKGSPSWTCGDRKRLRHVISHFTKNTSMHGVHYLHSGGHRMSCIAKFIYRLIFGVCVLMMMASIGFLCQESFGAESVYISSTSKEGESGPAEDILFPQYPRITVCRHPGFSRRSNDSEQKVLEYAHIALGYPFPTLDPEERTLMLHSTLAKVTGRNKTQKMVSFTNRLKDLKAAYEDLKARNPDFNLRQYIMSTSVECEEIFVHCLPYIFEISCCKMFKPVLTSFGLCYSMKPDRRLIALEKQSRDVDFSFVIDLKNVPDTEKAVAVGYLVLLSNPQFNALTNRFSSGLYINNGYATKVKTHLVKISREELFKPWHGLWTDCPKMPPHLDVWNNGDRYVKADCDQGYVDQKLREKCGCRSVLDPRNASLRLCDPVDQYDCFLKAALKDNLTGMTDECRNPCLEYYYENEVSFYGIGGQNFSRLVFMYDGSHYNFHEYRKTTVSGLLSQIGGVLGLYVGASIITAVELISFFASWLWYRFLPTRRISNAELSSDIRRKKTRDRIVYFY